MGLYLKAQLKEMWSKLSDGLDGVDDHTQIASRAGEGTSYSAHDRRFYLKQNRDICTPYNDLIFST